MLPQIVLKVLWTQIIFPSTEFTVVIFTELDWILLESPLEFDIARFIVEGSESLDKAPSFLLLFALLLIVVDITLDPVDHSIGIEEGKVMSWKQSWNLCDVVCHVCVRNVGQSLTLFIS